MSPNQNFEGNSVRANSNFRYTEGENAGRYRVDTPDSANHTMAMARTENMGVNNENLGRENMNDLNNSSSELAIGREAAEINNNINVMLNTEISDDRAIQMLLESREAARQAIARSRELDKEASANANRARLESQQAELQKQQEEIAQLRAKLSQMPNSAE